MVIKRPGNSDDDDNNDNIAMTAGRHNDVTCWCYNDRRLERIAFECPGTAEAHDRDRGRGGGWQGCGRSSSGRLGVDRAAATGEKE